MSQIDSNPFPYSDTNKRYHTLSYALKKEYGKKTAKIPLNAGFTCPNRDGTVDVGGCTFCSAKGSGDSILEFGSSLKKQYLANLERARRKWPDCLGIAYFQSFSNTYAPLEKLKDIYTPFYEDPDVTALAIATRSDCLDEEKIAWLASQGKETWIEIGLQTIHEQTAKAIHRGHDLQSVKDALDLCKKYHLKTCVHLMNGLPGESPEMMVESAKWVADQHPDAIKIHMLHLIEGTAMARKWKLDPFPLLSQEEYVNIVCDQLEVLPAEIIIERVTGDGMAEDLIGPEWTLKKTAVANDIDKELFARNSWQSKKYEPKESRK